MKAMFKRMMRDVVQVAALTAFLAAASALLMVHVWNQYRIMHIGYEIADVTSEHQRLLEQNKKLAIEAAVVGRTERLSDVARERYGLVPVQPDQVRLVALDREDRPTEGGSADALALAQ